MKDMLPFLLLGAVGYLLFQQMQTQQPATASYPRCGPGGPHLFSGETCIDASGNLVTS